MGISVSAFFRVFSGFIRGSSSQEPVHSGAGSKGHADNKETVFNSPIELASRALIQAWLDRKLDLAPFSSDGSSAAKNEFVLHQGFSEIQSSNLNPEVRGALLSLETILDDIKTKANLIPDNELRQSRCSSKIEMVIRKRFYEHNSGSHKDSVVNYDDIRAIIRSLKQVPVNSNKADVSALLRLVSSSQANDELFSDPLKLCIFFDRKYVGTNYNIAFLGPDFDGTLSKFNEGIRLLEQTSGFEDLDFFGSKDSVGKAVKAFARKMDALGKESQHFIQDGIPNGKSLVRSNVQDSFLCNASLIESAEAAIDELGRIRKVSSEVTKRLLGIDSEKVTSNLSQAYSRFNQVLTSLDISEEANLSHTLAQRFIAECRRGSTSQPYLLLGQHIQVA